MLFCFFVGTLLVPVKTGAKGDEIAVLYGLKNYYYVNIPIGVKLMTLQRNDVDRFYYPQIAINAGGQHYFKESNDMTRLGLDVEYADASFFYLAGAGFSLSAARPGIVVTRSFKNRNTGVDFKLNGGGTYQVMYTNTLLGGDAIKHESFGWCASAKVQFWKNRLAFGLMYQYSKLYNQGLIDGQRVNFFMGVRL